MNKKFCDEYGMTDETMDLACKLAAKHYMDDKDLGLMSNLIIHMMMEVGMSEKEFMRRYS